MKLYNHSSMKKKHLYAMIKMLESRVHDLESNVELRLKRLEGLHEKNRAATPPAEDPPAQTTKDTAAPVFIPVGPKSPFRTPPKTSCGKCHMTFEGVTSYSCLRTDCPLFPVPVAGI